MSDARNIFLAELRPECERAARRVAGALFLGSASIDDLAQDVAFRVMDYTARLPDGDAILSNPCRRRMLVERVTRLAGYELLRRRDVAQRHHKSKGYESSIAAGNAQPDPATEAARAEEAGTLLRITSVIPADGPARLAYDIAEKRTTLQQYASEKNVSLRTAQRHYLDGVEELQRLFKRATGG